MSLLQCALAMKEKNEGKTEKVLVILSQNISFNSKTQQNATHNSKTDTTPVKNQNRKLSY